MDPDRTYAHKPSDTDEPHLDDHHRAVADYATQVTPDSKTAPGGTPLTLLQEIVGNIHDLGKAHPRFQDALLGDSTTRGPEHAPLGAAAAFYVATERGFPSVDASIAAIAVARHHQNLPETQNPLTYIKRLKQRVIKPDTTDSALKTVISHIEEDDGPTQDIIGSFERASDDTVLWDDFVTAIESGELEDTVDEAVFRVTDRSEAYYTSLLDIWSTLSYADKIHASDTAIDDATPPQDPPPTARLRDHVNSLGDPETNDLDHVRQQAFEDVNGDSDEFRGRIHEFIESDAQVATLTLPTGLGKTLTGLTAGHILRDSTDASTIVYALPFTSIIDQTDGIIQDIFDIDPTDTTYTVDHYLRETVTVVDEPQASNFTREQRLLGDIWQANTVLTTFVQLFESVLGPTNHQALKLPNLRNSVIILDEPQALPDTDWDEIRDALHVLVNTYNAKIIFMTATQPGLLQPDDRFDTFALVPDHREYALASERVTYDFHESLSLDEDAISPQQAIGRVLDDTIIDETPTGSALIIGNTIASTRALASEITTQLTDEQEHDIVNLNAEYEEFLQQRETETPDLTSLSADEVLNELNGATPDADEFKGYLKDTAGEADAIVAHLSTRHRPLDRDILLDTISTLVADEQMPPLYFVSTQLVEAGVDISFPRVYRDFAPVPSIVQAAGRCNREFEQDTGTVTVWQLAHTDENSPVMPSEAVYAQTTNKLATTRDAINSVTGSEFPATASDTDVSVDSVEAYFDEIRAQYGIMGSAVRESNTEELNRYSLIGDDHRRSVDTVVARSPIEADVLEWVQNHQYGSDVHRVISALRDRTVSIGVYTDDATPIETTQPQIVPGDDRQTQYWTDALSEEASEHFDSTAGVMNGELANGAAV